MAPFFSPLTPAIVVSSGPPFFRPGPEQGASVVKLGAGGTPGRQKRTSTSVPPSSRGRMSIVPPWRWTMRWQRFKPNP